MIKTAAICALKGTITRYLKRNLNVSEYQVAGQHKNKKWLNHHWLGFQLSILLVLFLLSGVVAVLKAPLTTVFMPTQTQVPSDKPVPWAHLESELAKHYPRLQIYAVTIPKEPYLAAKATLMQAKSEHRGARKVEVFFDRATATILDEQHQENWLDKASRFHRNVTAQRSLSTWALVSAPLWLAVIIMSVYQYRHRLTRLWRVNNQHVSKTHAWLMAWLLPLSLMIALSASWFFAERILWQQNVAVYPNLPKSDGTVSDVALPLSDLMARVEQVAPDANIRFAGHPSSPTGTFSVLLQSSQPWVYYRAHQLHFNAFTGELIHVVLPDDVEGLAWWADLMRFIHYGETPWLMWMFALSGVVLALAICFASWRYLSKIKRQAGVAVFLTVISLNGVIFGLAVCGLYQLSEDMPYRGWPVVSPVL